MFLTSVLMTKLNLFILYMAKMKKMHVNAIGDSLTVKTCFSRLGHGVSRQV